jgi:beta-aspartyl-peptidase (threonine type)
MRVLKAFFLTVLLSGLAFAAFAAAKGRSEGPLAVIEEQQAAWNRGDMEAFMEGYWRSPELTFFYAGTARRGYDEVLARYRKRYQSEGAEMGSLTFSELDVEMLGGKAAMVRGRWRLGFREKSPLGGLFTLMMRRFPEGWKIVHDHTSSDGEA